MGLFGKKSKRSGGESSGGKHARGLRREERLMSVVDESEPGAAIEVMSDNTRFTISGGDKGSSASDAWVVLLLPTKDEGEGSFGGLSRRTDRDEAKGNFINLIHAEDINAVVTEELLEEEVLAIVPDEQTLGHMSEFSLLENAKYIWGVMAVSPATGGLMTFAVPGVGISSDEAVEGRHFARAKEISTGVATLEQYLPLDLIQTMLDIIALDGVTDDVDADGESISYGQVGLDVAMGLVNDAVTSAVQVREYPTEAEMLAPVYAAMPRLAGLASVVEPDQPADAGDVDEAPETADGPELAEDPFADDVADVDDAGAVDDDGDDPFATVVAAARTESETGPIDEVAAPVEVEDDYVPSAPVSGVDVDEERLREVADNEASGLVSSADVAEELARMREALIAEMRSASTPGGMPSVAAMSVPDSREFTLDDAQESALRLYANTDLDLSIDGQVFNNSLSFIPYQLQIPQTVPLTPWLGEQLETLVSNLNGQLYTVRQRNYEDLLRMYMKMMDLSIDEIHDSLRLDDTDNPYGEGYKVIEESDAKMRAGVEKMIAARRRELMNEREAAKQEFIDGEAKRAASTWENRNGAKWTGQINRVPDEVAAQIDSRTENSRRMLLEERRNNARAQLDAKLSQVIDELSPILDEHRKKERAIYDQANAQLHEFIEAHRGEDLHQADINERRLAADTRVADLTRENEAKIAALREEVAATMAAKDKYIAELRDDFDKQLTARNELAVAREANADEAVELERAARQRAEALHEQQMREVREAHEENLKMERAKAETLKETMRLHTEERKGENKKLITLMLAAVIIFACISLAVGALWLGPLMLR